MFDQAITQINYHNVKWPQQRNANWPSPSNDAVTVVAPRASVRHRSWIVGHVAGFSTAFANAAKTFGNSLLTQYFRLGLPQITIAISFHCSFSRPVREIAECAK